MNMKTCDLRIISKSEQPANIDIRSNVYLRLQTPLVVDKAFQRRVTGRGALGKLLHRLVPGQDPSEAGRSLLTVRQAAEWAWQTPCELCGCIPEGPVKKGAQETIEFRCPLGKCHPRNFVPRAFLLDVSVVDMATRRSGKPLNEVVRLALETNWRELSDREIVERFPRRYLLALTPWQAYMLTAAEIELALAVYVRELPDA
jgi:hypothetical protein